MRRRVHDLTFRFPRTTGEAFGCDGYEWLEGPYKRKRSVVRVLVWGLVILLILAVFKSAG